ncbi:MAG TPA: beta-L-arabinofuranosidase domain-containing protein, partial [Ohtaekwangia sp.]|nr:beta-L-arabinofuranosidase domain-containing protein [Ohtaekwangia sp.]
IAERGHFEGYDSTSKDPWKSGAYWQDHKPVVQQDEAVGHAVRAGYLYAAMADVAALTGDTALLRATDAIWNNVIGRKMYVQGGIGAVGDGERFGDNYQLPNATAYNETCAAIANVYWNHRMFLLHGDAKYIDVLERSLYNGLLSGVGMDGKSFFYTNAMEIKNFYQHKDMEASRSGWFTCSCCPTNVTRLIPSIPGYIYALKDNDIFVNLFANSNGTVVIDKKRIGIEQRNNYPWEGNLKFIITPEKPAAFNVRIRIPGWARNEVVPSDLYRFTDVTGKKVVVLINGKVTSYPVENGYAILKRTWKKGDVFEMILPMEVQKIEAHEDIKDNLGKVALQRGPLVYCAEWPDNGGKAGNIFIPVQTPLTSAHRPDLLQGVTIIRGDASAVAVAKDGSAVSTVKQPFVAIPYYAWAHRGKGEMVVWFPTRITDVDIIAK